VCLILGEKTSQLPKKKELFFSLNFVVCFAGEFSTNFWRKKYFLSFFICKQKVTQFYSKNTLRFLFLFFSSWDRTKKTFSSTFYKTTCSANYDGLRHLKILTDHFSIKIPNTITLMPHMGFFTCRVWSLFGALFFFFNYFFGKMFFQKNN
jgi:hypothetical protein